MTFSTVRDKAAGRDNAPIASRPALPRRLANRILRALEIRHQRQMLHEMPDELLRDVGINRSDIDSLAERVIDGRTDPTRRPPGFV